MSAKSVGISLIRVIFALVYTITILPFTVNFFKSIVNPVTKETLMNMVPLVKIHDFTLPLFLMSLEFAAVGLACAFWTKRSFIQKTGILLLFICCQLLPVTSLYYDVRGRDFQAEKKVFETNKTNEVNSISDRIKRLKIAINTLSEDIRSLSKQKYENTNSINDMFVYRIQPIFEGQELSDDITADIKSEIQKHHISRIRIEKKIEKLLDRKRALETKLAQWEDKLYQVKNKTMEQQTILEYIIRELFTTKSAFIVFLAGIFPLTILGLAFILPKNQNNRLSNNNTFNLQEHLEYGFSLPVEAHLGYAKMLAPSLWAYLTTHNASNTLANESVILHLQNEVDQQTLAKIEELKKEIQLSKLASEAKKYLVETIEKMALKNLSPEEEK